MGGISGRQDFAGRDDRLANEIVDTLRNIERTSRGSYDELVAMMTAARYSAVPSRIKKMNFLQLTSLRSLILGYQSRVQADSKGNFETSWRPELVGAGAVVTVPQTLTLKRPDGQIQRVIIGQNGGDLIASTFFPDNVSGIPDDTVTLIVGPTSLEVGGGTGVRCHAISPNDETLLVWDANLANDPDIQTTSLAADGTFVAAAVLVTLTSSGAGFTDRVIGEAFTDGANLWLPEYDDGNLDLVIHKINLTDLTITTQTINNVDAGSATGNLFIWAQGDFCLVIAESSVGPVTAYIAFELVDGAAPAALNLDPVGGTGIDIETGVPTRLLGGFGGSVHTTGGPRYRGFFTANAAGANGEAIHVIDFNPQIIDGLVGAPLAAAMITVVEATVQIFGQTFIWSAVGFNGLHGVSADDNRLLLATNLALVLTDETLAFTKLITFSLIESRQLSAMRGLDFEITSLDAVSAINVSLSNMAMLATIATGEHMVELGA